MEGLKNLGIFTAFVLGSIAFVSLLSYGLCAIVSAFGVNAGLFTCASVIFGFIVWVFIGDDVLFWWERRKERRK